MSSIANILATLSGIFIARVVYTFAQFLFMNLRRQDLSRYRHSNAYALVTGSSDGIGLAFAQELLAAGFNVILHGRNEAKLRVIQSDLAGRYPKLDVRYYIADAARSGPESWKEMETAVAKFRDLHITILINNIGGLVGVEPVLDNHEDRSAEQIEHVIALNSTYPTQLTRALLPILKSNEPSLIMNITSLAAAVPGPYGAIYNGAKAYLNHFSHTLTVEMSALNRQIEVILVEVGPTVTEGNPFSDTTNVFVPSARQVARGSLQKVGCGEWKVCGYWSFAVQKHALIWLPETVMRWVMIKAANAFLGTLKTKGRYKKTT